jgi:hypothetical protein
MLINPFHLNTEDLVGKIDDIVTIRSSQQSSSLCILFVSDYKLF